MAKFSSSGPKIFSGEVKTFRNSTSLSCSVHLNWKLLLLLFLSFLALSTFFLFFYNTKSGDNGDEELWSEQTIEDDEEMAIRDDDWTKFRRFFIAYANLTTNTSLKWIYDPQKIPFPLPEISEKPEIPCEWQVAYLQNLTFLVWRSLNMDHLYIDQNPLKLEPRLRTTLLTSLSTLRTLKMSTHMYNRSLELLSTKTPKALLAQLESMSLSTAVTRILGSLLSNYALVQEQQNNNTEALWFKEQAKAVGKAIHRLSKQLFSLPKRILSRRPQPASVNYCLGEVVHLLEFLYLDAVAGEENGYSQEMKDTLMRLTRNHLYQNHHNKSTDFESRLYMTTLNQSGWTSSGSSLFGPSAPFYWTLINVHCLMENRSSSAQDYLLYLQLFISAIDDALAARLITTNVDGWTFAQSVDFLNKTTAVGGQLDGQMDSSACGLGGLLGLGAWAMNRTKMAKNNEDQSYRNKSAKYLSLAINLTETCHELTQRSTGSLRGLLPDKVTFRPDGSIQLAKTVTHLHNDLAKSYLLLHRVTGDVRYRRYAWELARALVGHKRGYCLLKTEHTYTTLRYLTLTMSSSRTLSLGEYVFNEAGQPLPVLMRSR